MTDWAVSTVAAERWLCIFLNSFFTSARFIVLSLFDENHSTGKMCSRKSPSYLSCVVTNLQPVSDEIFQVYKDLLEFERIELNPTIISITKTEDWIKEIISVDVPYEDAPLKVLIFRPVNYKPPFQEYCISQV